jgi:Transposase DDE domain
MFESHHVSRYFDNRRYQSRLKARGKSTPGRANRQRAKTAKRLPKLSLAVHAASHLILAARATTGLGNDHPHFIPLLERAASRMRLSWVVADAGFDSESNHQAARRNLKIRSLIPATCGRPGAPKGYYRRLMRRRLQRHPDKRRYGQRWQVETVNSMVKRNLSSSCRSRTAWGRKRDLLLRAITHNLMIVENL